MRSYMGQAAAMFLMAAGFTLPALKDMSAPIAGACLQLLSTSPLLSWCTPAACVQPMRSVPAGYSTQANACLFTSAAYVYSPGLAVTGTLLYILAFALGAGPVTGLVVPELNSAKIRGGLALHSSTPKAGHAVSKKSVSLFGRLSGRVAGWLHGPALTLNTPLPCSPLPLPKQAAPWRPP